MNNQIGLIKPSFDESDIVAVKNVMLNDKVGKGEIVKEFEETMAKYIKVQGGIATSSGTAALYLAMRALGVQKDDEIILPSYTCLTLLNVVMYIGAKPLLLDNNYDVESMNFNINQEEIFKNISKKTKAIIIPHMFGTPSNVSKLKSLGIPIIEDGALALGAEINNKKIGCFGDISIFSFNSKMISTGKGGILLSNSKDILSSVIKLTNYESKIISFRTEPNKKKIKINYDLGYEMSDIQASIGLNQLKKLPSFIKRRREIAELYSEKFIDQGFTVLNMKKTKNNVFFRYIVETNKNVLQVLKKGFNNNIEYGRGVYPPLHYCYNNQQKKFPNAEKAIDSLVSIPIYPSLTVDEIEKIVYISKNIL